MVLEIIILVIAILLILAAFIIMRTYVFIHKASEDAGSDLPGVELTPIKVDKDLAARHLSEAIQIETISHEDPAENVAENFEKLHKLLEKNYPHLHKALKREIVGQASLLYTWEGKDASLDPVLLAAHQDVVPAEESSLSQWSYPPFSGKIAEGYIWGRGTLDIKSQLISLMEAVEQLVINDYKPERTVLLGFGSDEEVLGIGAKSIVALLQKRGVHLAGMIDEGGCIYDGIIPGVKGLAGAIGVAEKGYLSLKVFVDDHAGHSSTPADSNATSILIRALNKIVNNPFPAKVSMVVPMFEKLGAAATPIMQVAFGNLWLFGGIIKKTLLASGEAAATIRTTTAVTILKGGVKDNILPGHAEAVVNFRLLPGESIAYVCESLRKLIADDRVKFEPLHGNAWEASPVSPTTSMAYRHIASVTREFFPGAPCAPYIMLGGSDARNYYAICENVYRFSPYAMTTDDLSRIHGVNERLKVDAFAVMVDYFYRLIARWSQKEM
jgi:carboxypeptidase PM20D1